MLDPNVYQPGLSVDCVIFGFHENELKVLLLKLKGADKWALPGGFVRKNEDVDKEAVRILEQRTGLDNIFLKQFHFFGDVDRNVTGHVDTLVTNNVIPKELKSWFEQRFVTVGYYALVEYSKVKEPTHDMTSESCDWYPIKHLPELMLDHKKILETAHDSLKKELNYHPVGLDLLPDQFTMPELQALYETILERSLDRRNFRRKILSYDILIATDKRRTGGRHKAPRLYQFDKEKYKKATDSALRTGW